MSDPDQPVICNLHGKSHATFVCGHLPHGSGKGFYYGEEDDIRPDAWCDECDQRLLLNNGEWNDELETLADVTVICAGCYDGVRLRNEIPHKRNIPQGDFTIEKDGWELASAIRMNRLHPDTFKIPLPSEVNELDVDDLVKLLFAFSDEDKINLERMWVTIIKVEEDGFTGVLETEPIKIRSLKPATEIKFMHSHVASILTHENMDNLENQPTGYKLSSLSENQAYY